MTHRFRLFRNLAFAVGIVIALAFGTTQALADVDCTPLPPHTCNDKANPNAWCWDFCVVNDYLGGQCYGGLDCCVCVEK